MIHNHQRLIDLEDSESLKYVMPLLITYIHNISKSRFPNYGMYYLQRIYAQHINMFLVYLQRWRCPQHNLVY